MRQVLNFGLAALALAVSGLAVAAPSPALSTNKGVEPFAQCFTATQDSAGRAWAFVPRENGGGTFSNVGARGVSHPYFVEVADRGTTRQIHLSSVSDRALVLAVQHCI